MMTVPEYVEMNEGYRRHIYLDSEGIETIGIGFNLEEGFTREECLLILNLRLGYIRDTLADTIMGWEDLHPIRKLVLLDMCYNLGLTKLLKFKKMLNAIAAHNYDVAAMELLDSRYAKQVGKRADRNAQMLRTAQWYEAT